jgi:HPr kinase/phosphorylase
MSSGVGRGLHATAVVFGESGVAILGASGSGKSALALALLARARSSGRFGALIGDDRVWVRAADGRLIASGATHTAGLIERRAAGVQSTPSEPAAVIRLVVELSGRDCSWPRWPGEPNEYALEEISVPRLALNSAASATDNAMSVEERLELLVFHPRVERGFSLEQCAALHKNRKLVSRMASTTSEPRSDD